MTTHASAPWSLARYGRTPDVQSASARARLERQLERRWAELGPQMRATALDTLVDADWGPWTSADTRFAREDVPRSRAADQLEERVREGGASARTVAQARARWARRAREDVQAWTATTADEATWERARAALEGLASQMPGGLALARWALIAQGGEALTRAIEAATPWVAVEACRHLAPDALRRTPERWMIEVVRHYAREMGRSAPLEDANIERALAHWRWSRVRPPLRMLALRAGVEAPICDDGDWGRALVEEVEADEAGARARTEGWARTAQARERA